MAFAGIPEAAFDFYEALEVDNSRTFWLAHKSTYDSAVRAPVVALADALAAEFGEAKVYRPYRDVRFSTDKTPYKTSQGAFVALSSETGFYVEVSARGVRTGGGCYWFTPDRLAAYRAAVSADGATLARLLATAQRRGLAVGGETLKTRPRGIAADHPHLDLLRHRSLTLSRVIGFDPVVHTPTLVSAVSADWRAMRPLVTWLLAL